MFRHFLVSGMVSVMVLGAASLAHGSVRSNQQMSCQEQPNSLVVGQVSDTKMFSQPPSKTFPDGISRCWFTYSEVSSVVPDSLCGGPGEDNLTRIWIEVHCDQLPKTFEKVTSRVRITREGRLEANVVKIEKE